MPHSEVTLFRALSLSTLQYPLQARDSIELALLGKNNSGVTAPWSYGSDELAWSKESERQKKKTKGGKRVADPVGKAEWWFKFCWRDEQDDLLPWLRHSTGDCTHSLTAVTAQGQGLQVTSVQGQPQISGLFTTYIQPIFHLNPT